MSNKEILELNRITKTRLKELCKKHKLYQTPYLNDQLYLHYQGFQAIENLEEYTGLKCLWLESNAISEIHGLSCQPELKCLFLQNNLIKKIENLQSCIVLDTLNLASNHITRVENCGVDVLPVLSTLNLSRNYLRNSEGLRELVNCRNLWSLDLSHNRIDDILVVKVFANMPELRVLVLQGNPVVSQVPQYRKTLILECKNLTYLDSRPVFPKDRACAEAWKRGGYEEERKENERWLKKDRKKIRDSVNATLRLRQKQGGGDVQLLESTDDDDEENNTPKKLKKIPEEIVSTDLEITGVDQAEDSKPEFKSSESSLWDSSDYEDRMSNSADEEEPNGIKIQPKSLDENIEAIVDIQLQPNQEQTAIEDERRGIESQYSEEQLKVLKTKEDSVIPSKKINISRQDDEAKAFVDIPMQCNMTSDSSLSSGSFSNGSSIYSAGDGTGISNDANTIFESTPSEECFKDSNIKREYEENEADMRVKNEEDENSVKDDFVGLAHKLTFNISSESQFSDTEFSLQSPYLSPEEELGSLSQTSETDRYLSEVNDLNGKSVESNQLVSDVEDSGLFNISKSVDASELVLTSDDESEALPGLESILSKQTLNEEYDDSVWQDIILTELREKEVQKSNEDKFEIGEDTSIESEIITSSKANTLSSSLENSDEGNALIESFDELDASTWLEQILAKSLETYNEEQCQEKNEKVLAERTADSSWLENVLTASAEKSPFEMSNQSEGSSLLEYILNIKESSPEMPIEEVECVKNYVGMDEDESIHEKTSLQTILTTTGKNEGQNSSPEMFNTDHKHKDWLEKDEERALNEKLSLQNMLTALRTNQLEQWLGESEGEVDDDDEDEDLSEKQEHIFTQIGEDDEQSLSTMYNIEQGLNENEALDEKDNLESILKEIEEVDQRFEMEASNEELEKIGQGSGMQNSFSCSSPYEELFDNKHFSLMHTAFDKNYENSTISKEGAVLAQEEVLKGSSEVSTRIGGVLTRPTLDADEKTNTLSELGSGLSIDEDTKTSNCSEDMSWWEKTLAAARGSRDTPKVSTNDESNEEPLKQTLILEDEEEASALLERILATTHKKEVEIYPIQTESAEPPLTDIDDESKPTTTIRDVLTSFNKVAENITTTRYLTAFALTKDFSTQSSDQINRQVEEMNREQRERVSQMIDRVYAQKDKYNDTLEVVDGRLMVIKRSTGSLEELPPPISSSKYTSCGVSTTQASCNDSDSDDYGTALSVDEADDDDDCDIEQHASDTKIKKIPYLSTVYGNESRTPTEMGLDGDANCHRESNEQKLKVVELCNEIDAEWMEKGAARPAVSVTTEKGNGEEKASLMGKLYDGTTELQTNLSCRCYQQMHMDFDEATLEDIALIFESPEGGDSKFGYY